MGFAIPRKVKSLKRGHDVSGLLAILNDTSLGGRDRRAAAACLGQLGDASACDDLVVALRDPTVRGLAAEALGEIGGLHSVAPLAELRETTQNPIVRGSAEKALSLIASASSWDFVNIALDLYATTRERRAAQFAARCDEPVEAWSDCPMCEVPLHTRVEHAAFCRRCGRYYTDPSYTPTVSVEPATFEQLSGASATMLPAAMVEAMGFPATGAGRFGHIPARMAYRVREAYQTQAGVSLTTDSWLMRRTASLICGGGAEIPNGDEEVTDDQGEGLLEMTDGDTSDALPQPPEGFRWHDTTRFGFAIAVPRRFHLISNTLDPVAQCWRGDDESGEGEPDPNAQARWPEGLWDPEIVGELDDGRVQPFRLFEFDAIVGRTEPMTADTATELWFEARQMFTTALLAADLPGYRLLDVRDTTLGEFDALAFEYRWDGLRPGEDGGDHALLLWAPTPRAVFHVYHHCSQTEWGKRILELDEILETFRVLDE